jgi:hypothetical protein
MNPNPNQHQNDIHVPKVATKRGIGRKILNYAKV